MKNNTKTLRSLFYLITPGESSVEEVDQLPHPDYLTQCIPYFVTFIALEYLVQWWTGKRRTRLNDGVTSLSHGMYLVCFGLLRGGIFNLAYIKVYENWVLVPLRWDSPVTWYVAGLLVDFCYYWIHRASHEINFFWAKHQVHHSSEEFNLTTALRQSVFQEVLAWPFYLPMAFFVPPSIWLVHKQFNTLFQFWIHTGVVEDLGVLEYVLNTPKHHRVHHGSNRYCLDKNYAGVLIIWDRMFGTFAQEREDEPLVYGLVDQPQSFNPFYLQVYQYPKIVEKAREYDNWRDKLWAYLKGPGWSPGKPRLGNPEECPEIPDRQPFDVRLAYWKNAYVASHWGLLLFGFDSLSRHYFVLNQSTVAACVAYIIFSLTSLGWILEDRREISKMLGESGRSLVGLACLLFYMDNNATVFRQIVCGYYAISALVWTSQSLLLFILRDGNQNDAQVVDSNGFASSHHYQKVKTKQN